MPRTEFTFGPLDARASDRQLKGGALRSAVNLVPDSTGAETSASAQGTWQTAAEAEERLSRADVVALSAWEESTDGADEGRKLVAVCAGGVYLVDPSDWSEEELWSFDTDVDQAQITQLGASLWITTARSTNGASEGLGRPGPVLELREGTIYELQLPELPTVEVTTSTGGTLEDGDYLLRYAWLLDDGTIASPGGLWRLQLDTGNNYSLEFEIASYLSSFPSRWESRIEGLLVFMAPDVDEESEDVSPFRSPFYRIALIASTDVGASAEFDGDRVEVFSGETLTDENLIQHRIEAAACFSFNKRLMLGDVAYDYRRPVLEDLVEWEDGTENSGGDDYWLMMRVEIATPSGTIERYSEVLPFDATSAGDVQLAEEVIYYLDARAEKWEWLVSEDYDPTDPAAASWAKTAVGIDKNFREGAGNFAYVDLEGINDTGIDITVTGTEGRDVTDDFSDTVEASQSADGSTTDTETLTIADSLESGESATAITVTAELLAWVLIGASDPSDNVRATASIEVRALDGTGAELRSEEREVEAQAYGEGSDDESLSAHIQIDVSDAATVEVEAHGSVSASTSSSWDAEATIEEVEMSLAIEGGSGSSGPDVEAAHEKLDRDSNRLLTSSTYLPRELLAGRVEYVGGATDAIVGFAANALPISEGQFGQYAVYCLGRESVHVGEPGGAGVAWASWRLVAKTGCLGRQAFTNIEDVVAFASDDGIYLLTPQLEGPISKALHTPAFLEALGPEAALGYFRDGEADRRELWCAIGELVFCFSQAAGQWSILDRSRQAFARLDGALFGAGASAIYEEGASSEDVTFYLVTSGMHLGAIGTYKRLQRLWIRQHTAAKGLEWTLLARDPSGADVELQAGTLAELPFSVVDLARGMALEARLELAGHAAPGDRVLESFGFDVETRHQQRRPDTVDGQTEGGWTPSGGITASAYNDYSAAP